MANKKTDLSLKIPKDFVRALELDDFDRLKALIIDGASPDWGDRTGATPLMAAVVKNDPAFFEFLLSKGANPNAVTNENWTALHFCAQERQIEFGKKLLEKGANVNAQDGNGNTPLGRCLASRHGNYLEFARMLLAAGADPDVKNYHGISASEVFADVFDELKR